MGHHDCQRLIILGRLVGDGSSLLDRERMNSFRKDERTSVDR